MLVEAQIGENETEIMETQTIVEYELIIPETNESVTTRSRDAALDVFEKNWTVYERHTTTGNPSQHVQARQIVTITWNNNPEFERKEE